MTYKRFLNRICQQSTCSSRVLAAKITQRWAHTRDSKEIEMGTCFHNRLSSADADELVCENVNGVGHMGALAQLQKGCNKLGFELCI